MFHSFHFSFLVFGHSWRQIYENTKILHNLCLHFARQDGQDGKNGKKITQLKWPKYQKTKIWDERNIIKCQSNWVISSIFWVDFLEYTTFVISNPCTAHFTWNCWFIKPSQFDLQFTKTCNPHLVLKLLLRTSAILVL